MECLYCHKKFSSFRFWKGSEFCSKEHEDAYRSQTLSRLMDGGGDTAKASVAIEDALTRVPEAPGTTASEYAGPRRIGAPASAHPPSPPATFDLPPAGTHALETSAQTSSWRTEFENLPSGPSSTDGHGDVDQQTPEEALNALREIARGSRGTSRAPALPEEPPEVVPEQEDIPPVVAESPAPLENIDADDVFAELRRMAEATGEPERLEEAEESMDLPVAPEGFSALDRLMESPAPRSGLGKPSVDRKRAESLPPAEKPAPPETAKQEPAVSAKEKEPAKETVPVEAEESAPIEAQTAPDAAVEQPAAKTVTQPETVHPKPEAKTETQEAPEKVVSFPGPRQGAGEGTGRKPGRMARPRGAASGLFDSGIHDEFVTVNLSGLLREPSGLAAKSSALVLDEALKAPPTPSVDVPARDSELQPAAGITALWANEMISVEPQPLAPLPETAEDQGASDLREPRATEFSTSPPKFVKARREFISAGRWYEPVSVIALRETDSQPAFSVEHRPEPIGHVGKPGLPAGLAESMGVVQPNRGQLIRSELFNKEPEVRESAGTSWEAALETDVRRAYYG